jgi:hypothetical protein
MRWLEGRPDHRQTGKTGPIDRTQGLEPGDIAERDGRGKAITGYDGVGNPWNSMHLC